MSSERWYCLTEHSDLTLASTDTKMGESVIKVYILERRIFQLLRCCLSNFSCTIRCCCCCIRTWSQHPPACPGLPCETDQLADSTQFLFLYKPGFDRYLLVFILDGLLAQFIRFVFSSELGKRMLEGCPQSIRDPPTNWIGAAGILRYKRESDDQKIDLTTVQPKVLSSSFFLLFWVPYLANTSF